MVAKAQKLNVLVVGYGSIGRRHVKNLLKLREVGRIFVLTKSGSLSGAEKRERVTITRAPDLKNIDFAVVSNETSRHTRTVLGLVSRGIDVFVEKPLSNSFKDIARLKRLSKKNKSSVFVAYNMRFLGAMKLLKQKISEGFLGRLYFARIEAGQYLPDWRPGRDYWRSYSASKARGGGVEWDLSHEIDYMRYLFGDPVSKTVFKKKISDLEISSNDYFAGTYFFKNNFVCDVRLDYLQRKTRTLKAVGSKGEIFCDFINHTLILARGAKTTVLKKQNLFDMGRTYLDEMKYFINTLRNGRKPFVSIDDGIEVLKLAEGR